jgi:crotonobetainyl-CoA:carnitine CoA-transferase CaiB-like acyl-CoA transferase
VNDLRQALADEQIRARDMIIEVEHPVFGRIQEVGSAIKTAGAVRRPAPAPQLGEHTDQYLSLVLGYGAETIARLRSKGAIG